jgi:hypothetical protein
MAVIRSLSAAEERQPLTVGIRIDRSTGVNTRYLPIQLNLPARLINNSTQLLDQLNRLLGKAENEVGSATFITSGEAGEPIPNFSEFYLVMGGTGPTSVPSQLFFEENTPVILQRVDPALLNSRPARGDVLYPKRGTPWFFKAKDGSHDPDTFVDDGLCMDRVLAHFQIDPFPAYQEMTIEDFMYEVALTLHQRGISLAVIHPFLDVYMLQHNQAPYRKDNPFMTYLPSPKARPVSVRKAHYTDFRSPGKNEVLLWDGGSHLAIPEYCTNEEGNRFLVLVDGFYCTSTLMLYYLRRFKNTPVGTEPFGLFINREASQYYNLLNKGFTMTPYQHEHKYDVCTFYNKMVKKMEEPPRDTGREGYLFFDFETLTNKQGFLFPYSVSFMIIDVDPNDQHLPVLPSSITSMEELYKTFPSKVKFFYGADCADQLFDLIMVNKWQRSGLDRFSEMQTPMTCYRRLVGVTFNGSVFDNFFLYDAALRYNDREDRDITIYPRISREFWMGTALVQFWVDKYFSVFDVRRHLGGSLEANANAFKCINTKIADHMPRFQDIQVCYEEVFDWDLNRLLFEPHAALIPKNMTVEDYEDGVFPAFVDTLRKYNDCDVTSLAEIFFRYRANNLIPVDSGPDGKHLIDPPITLASESFQFWRKYIAGKMSIEKCWMDKLWVPLFYDIYAHIRNTSIVAGRTQCFHKPQYFDGPHVSMDVTSLYPYVMSIAPVYYPAGKHSMYNLQWDPEEVVQKFPLIDKLGLFLVDVDQSHLKAQDIPYILARKTLPGSIPSSASPRNDWHSPVVEDIWITSKEMQVCLDWQCHIHVKKMIIWPQRVRSIDLFGNLAELMFTKNQQDVYKQTNDPQYNPAIRQSAKLASNALYGKMMEGIHTSKRVTVTAESYAEIQKEMDPLSPVPKYTRCSAVYPWGTDMVVDVELNPAHPSKKLKQRPMIVGMYILAYARMYMFEHTYAKLGLSKCHYTDTDAIKCYRQDFDEILYPYLSNTIVPHWPDAEAYDPKYAHHPMFKDGSKVYGAFEDELGDNKGLWVIAKKMWACVPSDGDPAKWKIGTKGVTLKDVILTEAQVNQLRALDVKDPAYVKLCRDFFADQNNTVGNNPERFFSTMLNESCCYVLKSDLKKHVTQLSRVEWIEGVEPSKILQHFCKLSQAFRVMRLEPRRNQEVTELPMVTVELTNEVADA